MLERASGVKRNRIAESLAEMLRVGSDPIKIRKLLRCGHEDMVLPGIDPGKAICWKCALAVDPGDRETPW
jgi:hypothetical protein